SSFHCPEPTLLAHGAIEGKQRVGRECIKGLIVFQVSAHTVILSVQLKQEFTRKEPKSIEVARFKLKKPIMIA
ncbi:hypothetical protein, partial [Vibrio sp. 10N.247.311.47]|uniref:hypothetical protein n=1 Tax=Vibrio sp. 10N.247.311.47 TaxID=3229988 RepID=UPI00355302C8